MSYLLMPQGGAGLNINARNIARFRRWEHGGMNDYLQVGDTNPGPMNPRLVARCRRAQQMIGRCQSRGALAGMGDNLLEQAKALYDKVRPTVSKLYKSVTDKPLQTADGEVVVPGNPVLVAEEAPATSGIPWGMIAVGVGLAVLIGGMRR